MRDMKCDEQEGRIVPRRGFIAKRRRNQEAEKQIYSRTQKANKQKLQELAEIENRNEKTESEQESVGL